MAGLASRDLDLGEFYRAARLVARLGGDGEQRLAVEQDRLVGEAGLVLEGGRDVVGAGNVRWR